MCVWFEKNTGEWVSEFVSPAAVSFFFLFFVTSLSFEKILKFSRDDKKNCVFVTIFASAVKKHVHNNHDNDNDDNTN